VIRPPSWPSTAESHRFVGHATQAKIVTTAAATARSASTPVCANRSASIRQVTDLGVFVCAAYLAPGTVTAAASGTANEQLPDEGDRCREPAPGLQGAHADAHDKPMLCFSAVILEEVITPGQRQSSDPLARTQAGRYRQPRLTPGACDVLAYTRTEIGEPRSVTAAPTRPARPFFPSRE
jgi:hypothetical protein